jgi:hypothetical protein
MLDTGSMRAGAVTVDAGGSCAVAAAAAVKDIPAGAVAVAIDRTGGVGNAGGGPKSATTRVASRPLASAVVSASAVAAVGAGVVFANGEPTRGAAVLGCLRPIAAVVPDRGPLGVSGVAAALTGAVEEIDAGSVPAPFGAADADEPVNELPCWPPEATTSAGAPRRTRLIGVSEGAAPVGADAAGDDVSGPPELLAATRPDALSGRR